MKQKAVCQSRHFCRQALSCPSIKLPNPQTLILDGVEAEILLSDFAQQLRRRNADVPDIYLTLLDAAGLSRTLNKNQNAKAKQRGSWCLSKYERQKQQGLQTQGGADCSSMRNLVKTSTLTVPIVRNFSHSKPSSKKKHLSHVNSRE